jgi:hypothetical protein
MISTDPSLRGCSGSAGLAVRILDFATWRRRCPRSSLTNGMWAGSARPSADRSPPPVCWSIAVASSQLMLPKRADKNSGGSPGMANGMRLGSGGSPPIASERNDTAPLARGNPLKCCADCFGQGFQVERLSEQEVIAQGVPKA